MRSRMRSTVAAVLIAASRGWLPAQGIEQGFVGIAVLRPADRGLEQARRLAGLQTQHAIDLADIVAACGQARLDLLAFLEIERRLAGRPSRHDAGTAEDALAEISDRERIRGRVVVAQDRPEVLRNEEGRPVPAGQ